MIYPTVVVRTKIHAVNDKKTCLCGLTFNENLHLKQKQLLKKIQFKDINSISCKKCRSELRELEKNK